MLELVISSFVNRLKEQIEVTINKYDNKTLGGGKNASAVGNAALLSLLNKAYQDVPEEYQRTFWDLVTSDNFQFFVEGYTSMKVTSLEDPVWKYALFLSEPELY